jgi:hypothetical protein
MSCVRGFLTVLLLISIGACMAEREDDRSNKPKASMSRVQPQVAKPRIESGAALLVCAYDNADKFHKNHLQGAISLQVLQGRENSLAETQEIIFYCA